MTQRAEVSAGRVVVRGPRVADAARVLSTEALTFLARLGVEFAPQLEALLARRRAVQAKYDAGALPDFLPETAAVRAGDWRIAKLPPALERRVVEITGPVDRKMIINALNSGADVFMADFEDSTAPSFENVIAGQANLASAVRGTLELVVPGGGKTYRVGPNPALLMVRPRGLHLVESHLTLDGRALPAALVDFGLFFFHNARALAAEKRGPFFYLPKLESHLEARLYDTMFTFAERALDVPHGATKATVLIETLPAAFEMDEILYELRDHAAGLNCGRWDYIFSYTKTLREHADRVLPDRAQVTMTQPNMRAYTSLLIKTCHRRGAFAMGGMAAQIPIKDDAAKNEQALGKVRADKEREAKSGHDGTWVAHPGLVAIAREAFAAHFSGPNQLGVSRSEVEVTQRELLAVPSGTRTDEGLRHNVRVGILYLEAWLRGTGCVPIEHLMEDAATAEIARTQLWQWLRHGATTDDGRAIDRRRIEATADEELAKVRQALGEARYSASRCDEARALFLEVATDLARFTDFLTLPAYERLVAT